MAANKRRVGSTVENLIQTEIQLPKVPIQLEKKQSKESESSGRRLFISNIQKQIPDWADNDDVTGYNIYVWSTRKVKCHFKNP